MTATASSACGSSVRVGSRRMSAGSLESQSICFFAYTRVFFAMRGIAMSRDMVPSNIANISL